MASSGSFDTSGYDGRYLRLEWWVESQSIAENSTTIGWRLVGAGGNSSVWYEAGNFHVNIDGDVVYQSGGRIRLYAGTVVASGTKKLYHDNVGARSFWAYAEAGIYYYAVNCSGEGTFSLPRIPRYATSNQSLTSKTETSITMKWSSDSTVDYIWYSKNNGSSWTGIDVADGKSGSYTISGLTAGTTYQIKTRVRRKDSQLTTDSSTLSVATYDYPYASSMPNFTIGEKLTLGIYNPLNRTVVVNILGADDSQISDDETAGTSISGYNDDTVVNRLYNSIPNSKSGTYKVKVTYGDKVSTKTGGTYTVNPANCLPSIETVSYRDSNPTTTAVTQNNQNIVQNLSTVVYTASGLSAQKGASVQSVSVAVNGNSYGLVLNSDATSATGGNATINSNYDVVATVTVTDSRGISASKDVTVKMLEWGLPSAIPVIRRHNNFYTATDITVDANYSYIDGKNTIDIKFRYKKVGDADYGEYESLSDNVTYTFNADNDYAWDVQVVLTDAFGATTTYNDSLSRGMPILYIDRILSSIGFNCFPKDEKSVEVNGVNVERNVATATLSAQITDLYTSAYTMLELDLPNVAGSKLSVNNYGEIVIGSGVTKVLVSGIIAFEQIAVAGNRHAIICKNSYSAANTLAWTGDTMAVSDAKSLVIPPQLVNVQEGDTIGLYYWTQQSTDRIGGNEYGGRTSLTVEVVA